MGADSGPVFAPAPEHAVSQIIQPPCGCVECVAGPGLDHIARNQERLERVLGPLTSIESWDWCPTCQHSVRVKSTRAGQGWENVCEHLHRWRSYE